MADEDRAACDPVAKDREEPETVHGRSEDKKEV